MIPFHTFPLSMTMKRCEKCGKTATLAVNYRRGDKTYYRKICNSCDQTNRAARKKSKTVISSGGYQKKNRCDRCGFTAKTSHQMTVHYTDGNRHNVNIRNLRTYCMNCEIEVRTVGRRNDHLIADF